MLITGRASSDYLQVTQLNLRDYVQAYMSKGNTNNKSQNVDVITLHPSGNKQGLGLHVTVCGKGYALLHMERATHQ